MAGVKWTPDEDAEFRALASAGYGVLAIAERMSKRPAGVKRYANLHGIYLIKHPEGDLRKRWANLIGPMKAELRATIEGI